MPRGFLDLDVQFPRLEGMEDDRARFISIEDHERMMLENLRYILRNIGPDNFNQAEVIAWLLSLGFGKGGERYDMSLEASIEVQTAGLIERTYSLESLTAETMTAAAALTSAAATMAAYSTSTSAATAQGAIRATAGNVTAVPEIIAPGG